MSATEELRRLLDERGAEWQANDTDVLLNTLWKNEEGQLCSYSEAIGEGSESWYKDVSLYDCTPEQAIAATLGAKRDRTEEWLLNACNQAARDYIADLERKLEAATLGSGKLTAEQVRDLIKRHSMAVDYVGNVRRLDNSVFEEIADELNATMGGGECEWVWVESWTDTTDGRECDYAHWMPDCGCWSEYDRRFSDFDDYAEKPTGIAFCERCGKAVKR